MAGPIQYQENSGYAVIFPSRQDAIQ